jgi:hypothetical protein
MIVITQRKANKAYKNAEKNSELFPIDKNYPYFDQKGAYIDKDKNGCIVVYEKVIVKEEVPLRLSKRKKADQ